MKFIKLASIIICFCSLVLTVKVISNKKRGDLPTCKAGQKFIQNPSHPPKVNGCGPGGSSFLLKELNKQLNKWEPEFIPCCNAHDTCFGTCHPNALNECNDNFDNCMKDVCSKKKRWEN